MSEQYMQARINELLSQIEDLNHDLKEQKELVEWWQENYYKMEQLMLSMEDRLEKLVAEEERKRK